METVTGQPRVWTPPPGMSLEVQQGWRAFFSSTWTNYELDGVGYRDLYIAQHGTCYICRKVNGKNPDDPKARGGKRLGVDHNHVTGAVRGLLCTSGPQSKVPGCNWIIGVRSVDALERAVKYLRTEPAQLVLLMRERIERAELMGVEVDADQLMTTILGLK